jgi:hypothetical protein
MNTELRNRFLLMSEARSKEIVKETADFIGIADEIVPTEKKFSLFWIIRNWVIVRELLNLLFDFLITAKNKIS